MENYPLEKVTRYPAVSPITSSARSRPLADMHLNSTDTSNAYEFKLVKFSASAIGHTAIKSTPKKHFISTRSRPIDTSPINCNYNIFSSELLWCAARDKHWELVKELIGKGHTDLNISPAQGPNRGFTVLWFAARSGRWDLVQLLVEKGATIADPHFNGRTELECEIIIAMLDGTSDDLQRARDLKEERHFILSVVQAFIIIKELKTLFNKFEEGIKGIDKATFKDFIEKNFIGKFIELENIIINCNISIYLKFKLYDEIIALFDSPLCGYKLISNVESLNSKLYFDICLYNGVFNLTKKISVIKKPETIKEEVANTNVDIVYGKINPELMESLGLEYSPGNESYEGTCKRKYK